MLFDYACEISNKIKVVYIQRNKWIVGYNFWKNWGMLVWIDITK